jgi:hypothetical protein
VRDELHLPAKLIGARIRDVSIVRIRGILDGDVVVREDANGARNWGDPAQLHHRL